MNHALSFPFILKKGEDKALY